MAYSIRVGGPTAGTVVRVIGHRHLNTLSRGHVSFANIVRSTITVSIAEVEGVFTESIQVKPVKLGLLAYGTCAKRLDQLVRSVISSPDCFFNV